MTVYGWSYSLHLSPITVLSPNKNLDEGHLEEDEDDVK